MVYFADPLGDLNIVAVRKIGACQRFDFKGASGFTNRDLVSCQVGKIVCSRYLIEKADLGSSRWIRLRDVSASKEKEINLS